MLISELEFTEDEHFVSWSISFITGDVLLHEKDDFYLFKY